MRSITDANGTVHTTNLGCWWWAIVAPQIRPELVYLSAGVGSRPGAHVCTAWHDPPYKRDFSSVVLLRPIADGSEVTDGATWGTLLDAARVHWTEPQLHLVPMLGGGWRVVGFQRQRDDSVGAHGPTEVDALLMALAQQPSSDAS